MRPLEKVGNTADCFVNSASPVSSDGRISSSDSEQADAEWSLIPATCSTYLAFSKLSQNPGRRFGVPKAMYTIFTCSVAFSSRVGSPPRSYAPRSPPRCLVVVSKRLTLVSVVLAQSSWDGSGSGEVEVYPQVHDPQCMSTSTSVAAEPPNVVFPSSFAAHWRQLVSQSGLLLVALPAP